jgi:hypothetical protein
MEGQIVSTLAFPGHMVCVAWKQIMCQKMDEAVYQSKFIYKTVKLGGDLVHEPLG